MYMETTLVEDSVVILQSMSNSIINECFDLLDLIESALNINELKMILTDELVLIDEVNSYIIIKGNYQHVAACIKITIIKNNEAKITFQKYD